MTSWPTEGKTVSGTIGLYIVFKTRVRVRSGEIVQPGGGDGLGRSTLRQGGA